MKTILQKALVIAGACLISGSVFAHVKYTGRDLFIKNQTDVCIALGNLIIYPGTFVHVPMKTHVRTIRLKTVGPQGRWVCLVAPGGARTETVSVVGLNEGLGCTVSEGVKLDTVIGS